MYVITHHSSGTSLLSSNTSMVNWNGGWKESAQNTRTYGIGTEKGKGRIGAVRRMKVMAGSEVLAQDRKLASTRSRQPCPKKG